jgi:AcrR family transcriptional regulator
MPRSIDSDLRRRDLADAAWRVIRRDGLEGASVRAVAAEAGLSMGSLRHYFGTQSELYTFAMGQVMHAIRSRIESLELPADSRQAAEQIVAELLPLDEQRRAESEVWLAFTTRALVDPALRVLRNEAYDELRDACRQLVSRLRGTDRLTEDQLTLEAERLYALVDGLLLHSIIAPQRAPASLLVCVIADHLDLIVARPAGARSTAAKRR